MKILKLIYSIYVMIVFVLLLLPGAPIIIIGSFLKEKTSSKIAHYLLKFYSFAWSILCGIIPINYNRKKVDFSKTTIYIANHQSYFDPVNMYMAIPSFFKGLGKIEVTKAPLFGILYKMAVIAVDRSSARASALSFRNMLNKIKEGTSILLFPEGTFMDKPQQELVRFKDGAFTLAIKAQTDLQPLLFLDTVHRIPPRTFSNFTPGLLRAVFLPPIRINAQTDLKGTKEFAQKYMQACLDYCREKEISGVWEFGTKLLQRENLLGKI